MNVGYALADPPGSQTLGTRIIELPISDFISQPLLVHDVNTRKTFAEFPFREQ
jgi:hypothetical protein